MTYTFTARHHSLDVRLGKGANRSVFVYDDDTVVKIATSEFNTDANLREVGVWEDTASCSPHRSAFAAIVEYTDDYTWIRQERVVQTLQSVLKTLMHEYTETYDDDDLRQVVAKYVPDVLCVLDIAETYDIGDVHDENIGQRADGTWCIIDYAN